MDHRWTEENSIRLELAVSLRGRDWVTIAGDPRFGLTDYSPDALRMRYNSMAETEEWMDDDDDLSEDEQVDYYDVEGYINGATDNDELSDDPDWLPPDVPEVPEAAADPDWWDWWDVADPDYVPKVPVADAVVVEGRYDFRRRTDNPNMRRIAVYVGPPNINELRKPQVRFNWNEDYYKQFAIAMSIYGRKWSKMCTDPRIGLPSNLKGSNLKDKWRSMDIDDISCSEDDSDPDDFEEDSDGEEYHGYGLYLLGPSQLADADDGQVDLNPVQPGFSSFTPPDFEYQWGSNFEVGSSSNPPRKSSTVTPRRLPSPSRRHRHRRSRSPPSIDPSILRPLRINEHSAAQPTPPNPPVVLPPNPNHPGAVARRPPLIPPNPNHPDAVAPRPPLMLPNPNHLGAVPPRLPNPNHHGVVHPRPQLNPFLSVPRLPRTPRVEVFPPPPPPEEP